MEELNQDFLEWHERKILLENRVDLPHFDVGEIWWCSLGINIGTEINGKGKEFLRPVVVLRKYNQFGCLILPLSSVRKRDKDNLSIGSVQGKPATVNLSQLRTISSKRLIEKITTIDKADLLYIQKTVMEYNFPPQSFEILPPKDSGEQPEGQR